MLKLELTTNWQNIGNTELEVQISSNSKCRLYYGITAPIEDKDGFIIQLISSEFKTLKAPSEGFIWIKKMDTEDTVYIKYRQIVETKNYYTEVAKGNVSGTKVIHKFGRNTDVSTTTFEAIWNGGGRYTGFDAVDAQLVTIVSSVATDTVDGTGLRTLRLYGLDANLEEQIEDVVLNGTTPVTSTLAYKRLDRAKGLTAGVDHYNNGDITIRQSVTTANIFAVIPATYNTTMIACYTIPSNMTGYILSQRAAIANKQSASVEVRIQVKSPGDVFTINGESALNSIGTGFIYVDFKVPIKLESGTDIFIDAKASSSVAVSAFFDIMLVEN